jgi:hypothetical protein
MGMGAFIRPFQGENPDVIIRKVGQIIGHQVELEWGVACIGANSQMF